jgi:hypothetical protein
VFDTLIEAVADPGAEGWDPREYLRIVEILDSVPTLARVNLGRHIRLRMTESIEQQQRKSFTSVDRDSSDRIVFHFDYSDAQQGAADERGFVAEVVAYATLRHTHGIEAGARPESTTLAIGIRNYGDRSRRHAHVLLWGDVAPLTPDLRASMEATYGIFDGESVRGAK